MCVQWWYQELPAAVEIISNRLRTLRPARAPNAIASAAVARWIPNIKLLTSFTLLKMANNSCSEGVDLSTKIRKSSETA